MIYTLNIKNPQNTLFNYISELYFDDVLDLISKEYSFKEGKNIIIGENGSGKSTIINILAKYTFCDEEGYSKITKEKIHEFFIKDFSNENPIDGIDVKGNYDISTFKTINKGEYKQDSESLNTIDKFTSHIEKLNISSGEQTIQSIMDLFEYAFNVDYSKINFDFLKNQNNFNNIWKEKAEILLNYYKKNHIEEENPIVTTLMDEPDRHLSIKNLDKLYTILSTNKENEQMIATIHNPALIYRLSKLDNINFIELTEGYLDKVINFINN